MLPTSHDPCSRAFSYVNSYPFAEGLRPDEDWAPSTATACLGWGWAPSAMTAAPPGWGWALAATTAARPAPHPAPHPDRRQRRPRSVPTARSIAWRGSLYPGRASSPSPSAAPRWQASHAAGYHPAARAVAAATEPRPPTARGPSPVGAEPPGRGGACAPEKRWRCCCCRRLPPCVAGGGGAVVCG